MRNRGDGKAVEDTGMNRARPGNHQELFFVHFFSFTSKSLLIVSIIFKKSSQFAQNLFGEKAHRFFLCITGIHILYQ
jgi:hypothetical protein